MSEIGEVGQVGVQVVRVAFDGAELAFKLGTQITKESIEMIKKTLKLLAFLHTKSLLNNKKRHAILGAGKTSMKYMEPGANFLNIKIDEKDRKLTEKLLKQYGVLFTKLPDLNRGDGMCEYLYNAKDVSKVNMVIDRLNAIDISKKQSIHNAAVSQSMEQYLANVSMEELDKALQRDDPTAYEEMQRKFGEDLNNVEESLEHARSESVDNEKKQVEEEPRQQDETISKDEMIKEDNSNRRYATTKPKNYQAERAVDLTEFEKKNEKKVILKEEVRKQIRFDEMDRNSDKYIKISLNEGLVIDENAHSMKFTMPKSEKDKFLWISKKDLSVADQGKTFFGYLDKEKKYTICSISNESKEKLKGKEVFERYLDPVERFEFKEKEKDRTVEQVNAKKDSKNQDNTTAAVLKESSVIENKETVSVKKQGPKKSR